MLFSPAKVIFNNVRTGKQFQFGETRNDILQSSWGVNE
jgi:methenyltetrahydromethanopterin cyclohydrolase